MSDHDWWSDPLYLAEHDRREQRELEQREWEEEQRRERLDRFRWDAMQFRCNPDESGGYADDDPKHPTYYERMADLWDNRDEAA